MDQDHDRSWGRRFLGDACTWLLHATICAGSVAVVTDVVLLAWRGASARNTAWTGLVALALVGLLALPLAPFAVLLERCVAWIERAPPRWRWLWFAPVVALAAVVGWANVSSMQGSNTRAFAVAAFVVAAAAAALLGRYVSHAATATLALVAVALDVAVPRPFYRQLHDLLGAFVLACAVMALPALRRRLALLRPARLLAAVACLVGGALSIVHNVDARAPGWRAVAVQSSRYQPRIARFLRALVDVDGDGFSPVAWGADCDDLDAGRNPFAQDFPGAGDANCNGVDPPSTPTEADHGLAPPIGHADLPRGTVDRVVLVTVDCLRADALRPDLMPSLSALSARGLRFTRFYAAAASTRASTMLMQRGTTRAEPVADRLARRGVTSTAVVGLRNALFRNALAGFGRTQMPPSNRPWTAAEVTDVAIADLAASGADPHYLWIHYYDAHAPYDGQSITPIDVLEFNSSPPEYFAQLRKIDVELGRLVAAIDARDGSGPGTSRTVILVTGDHGEGLGEHGVPAHHVGAWEAVVRVPAVLVAPGVSPAIHDGLASHRDLPATVLGAFGVAGDSAGAEDFGRSWFRLRDSATAPLHRFVAIRSGRAASGEMTLSPILAIVEGRYKLIRTLDDNLFQLYDVVGDPGETNDLESVDPARVAAMTHDLALFRDLDRWPQSSAPLDIGP